MPVPLNAYLCSIAKNIPILTVFQLIAVAYVVAEVAMSSLVFIRHCFQHLEYVQDTSQLFLDVSQIACLHDTWNCLDFFFLSLSLPATLATTVAWEQTVGFAQVEVAQRPQLQQNMHATTR